MAPHAWTGDLRRVPFPEVIARLHRERANGTLYCVRHSATRSVQLADGVPCWAGSSDPDDSARAWLYRRGHITLASIGGDGGDGERRTAEFFNDPVTRGLIETHAHELVLDLFSWGDGAFIFQQFDVPPSTRMQFTATFAELCHCGLLEHGIKPGGSDCLPSACLTSGSLWPTIAATVAMKSTSETV